MPTIEGKRIRSRWPVLLGAAAVLCANLVLSLVYYDRSWTHADDGHYIHVADRLLGGEVLNRDVEELHPGYVHFINALALKAFGRDLVSLRIPLMAMNVVGSLIVFGLFAPRGMGAAVIAAMAASGLGVLQIATPLTGLYSSFLTVSIIAVLHWLPSERRSRLILAGFLLAVMFLFRQLSAVLVGMGVLTYLLIEHRPGAGRPGTLARALPAVMSAGLTAYLLTSTDLGGIVLIGVWPLGVMIASWHRVKANNREVGRMVLLLAAGGAIGLIPILGYHLVHGSVHYWVRDVFVRSLSVTRLDHIADGRYYAYLILGLVNVVLGDSAAIRINGLYWAILPLLSVMNGLAVWRMLTRRLKVPEGALLLPVIAAFHALVSVFNQITFYLYLSAGLSLVSFLWWSPYRWKRSVVPGVLAILLVSVGIFYHAGQPHTRSFESVVEGARGALAPSGLPGAAIWMDPDESARYRKLIDTIRRETAPGDSIFVIPNDAAVYFLSDRVNPFRIFNPTLSLLNAEEVDVFLDQFDRVAPPLLIHNTDSPYNTELTGRFLAAALEDYALTAVIGSFRVFRRLP